MLTLALATLLQAAPPVSADGALRLPGVSLSLESIRRDDGMACLTTTKRAVRLGPQVRVERACGVEEVWTQVDSAIEHELFVARSPGGTGALRLRLRVQGPWHHADENGHVFAGPGASDGWTYGEAFVLPGRAHIDVVRTETGLELIIPDALVRFPLHIDPLVFPRAVRIVDQPLLFPAGPSESDEANPSVTWNTNGTYGIVAYSDDRRGVWPDLFGLVVGFDEGVVRSNLVPFPGAQLHPAVLATRDGGMAIAFEDYSSGPTTPSLVVAVIDDQFDAGPGRSEVLFNARAPSFTWDPDVGVVLGYAQGGTTLVVRSVDALLFGDGGVLMTASLDAGLIERTSVASREGKQGIAIELASRRVRYFFEGGEVQLPQISVGTVAQTSPSVVISDFEESYVAWSEEGLLPMNDSVQVRKFDALGQVTPGNFPGETQAALVNFDSRVLLLTFGAPSSMGARRSLSVHDLTRDVLLGSFAISRSGNLAELSADSRGSQILLAWSDRTPLEQRNVNIGILRDVPDAGFEARFMARDAVSSQHDVRVGFRDGVGLVVWREASNVIRAQWVESLGQKVVDTFNVADGTLALRFDGLDVAVGDDDALIAVRAFLADGRVRMLTFRVGRGDTSVLPGAGFDLPAGERPPPPLVAFSGSSYFVGTARIGGYQLLETDGNTTRTPPLIPTGVNAGSFDLDCLDGHCALAWVESSRVKLIRDLTQPLDIVDLGAAPGPVTLTNDGDQFFVHWQAPDPNGGAMLITDFFAPGDMPTNFAMTPLLDGQGNTLIAATIDGAGTNPLVVAVTDNAGPARTWLVELGSPPPWRAFDAAANARAVATSKKSSSGVVVFEQFGTRQVTEAFVVPWDVADAGNAGTDAGPGFDAGPGGDAGLDAGADGGTFNLNSTSCGNCSSVGGGSSGWLFVLVALGALLARRNRGVLLALLLVGGVADAQISPVHDVELTGPRAGGRLPNEGYTPTVASSPDAGAAVVAWVDLRRGDEDIFAMRVTGTDAGLTSPLVFGVGAQTQPGLAYEASGLYVLAWQEFQGTTPVVRVARMNPDTLQVMMPAGARPQARAPSVFSDKGQVWVCFESLASPMGAGRSLIIQAANDLITGVGSNAVVLGQWGAYDAGTVTRTVCVTGCTRCSPRRPPRTSTSSTTRSR